MRSERSINKISIAASCSLVFLVLLGCIGCTRYIDKTQGEREIKIAQGYLRYYPDSNILVYKSNVGLKADKETFHPKPFYVPLPKGLVWYEFSDPQLFTFYYRNTQVVSISIDLSPATAMHDTTYVPDRPEIEKYLSRYNVEFHKKYDVRNMAVKPGRRQLMIVKGSAKILLFNISRTEYDLFVSDLKKFEFLR